MRPIDVSNGVRNSRLLGTVALGVVLLGFVAAGPAGADTDPAQPAQVLLRIGIVPLRDDADQPKLAARLTAMLRARLAARFKGVEFVAIDPATLGNSYVNGPLLLDEAVELGRSTGVDALLDGVFGGVTIAGGSWPSMTSSAPEARGRLRWRLVECAEGLLLADGNIDPERNKAYSQRIRTEKELQNRVLQDLTLAVGDELAQLGRLPEKQGGTLADQPGAAADPPASTAEPISLTGDNDAEDHQEDSEADAGAEGRD